MLREIKRGSSAYNILKLFALSLLTGVVAVSVWEFLAEEIFSLELISRQSFWRELIEISVISLVFAFLSIPMWMYFIRNLNRARAESAESEVISKNIFQAAPGMSAITESETGRHIDVSERWLVTLGYQRDEVIGKTSEELKIWPTAKVRRRIVEEFDRNDGHLRDYETQICTKSGDTIDVLVSGEKIIYEGEERLFFVAQDVSAIKQAERNLRESERRARAAEHQLKEAIESTSDGFVLYDADSRLIICNKKFKDFYGYSNADVGPDATWHTLGDLDIERGTVVLDDISSNAYMDRREQQEGPPKSFPVKLADGRRILIRDRKTLSGGVVSIQTDVTENEKLLDDLRSARDELEDRVSERTKDLELEIVERKTMEYKLRDALSAVQVADQAKTEFLATMSHELRTPLNAIIGFTTVMRDGHFGKIENQRYQDYLGDIQASGEHLLGLINDILDVSAVEAGKLELVEGVYKLSDIIDSSIRLITPRAEKGGIHLSVVNMDKTDCMIRVDERRMRQILVNLLSNAIKFTPAGGAVQIETNIKSGSNLSILVTDSGIGMSEQDIKDALQPFTQVGDTFSRTQEGTGLGLPLTKSLIEMHGGELIIESALDIGTIMTVNLPFDRIE